MSAEAPSIGLLGRPIVLAATADPAAWAVWNQFTDLTCQTPSLDTIHNSPYSPGFGFEAEPPYVQVHIGEGAHPGEQWWIVGGLSLSSNRRVETQIVYLTNQPSDIKSPKGEYWFPVCGGFDGCATVPSYETPNSQVVPYSEVRRWWDETITAWTPQMRDRGAAAWAKALSCLPARNDRLP